MRLTHRFARWEAHIAGARNVGMDSNFWSHGYRNSRYAEPLDGSLKQSDGLVTHRSARGQYYDISSLSQQSLCYERGCCITQQPPIWNKAHKAIVHRRYGSDYTSIHQFVQPIKGKNAVWVFVGIGCIVVNVVHCQFACWCITGNLTKTGVTMRIEQIVGWLAFQVYACGGDQRNTTLGKWLAQRRPGYGCISCEIGSVMHFGNKLEPAPKTFIQVRSWHAFYDLQILCPQQCSSKVEVTDLRISQDFIVGAYQPYS